MVVRSIAHVARGSLPIPVVAPTGTTISAWLCRPNSATPWEYLAISLHFRFVKIDFQGSRATSDGGLILVRELDERLGFGELIAQQLSDLRRGENTQLPLADLLRQSVYSRIAGYEDVNDAERLSQDPTFRLIGSEKIWDRGAALTSRLFVECNKKKGVRGFGFREQRGSPLLQGRKRLRDEECGSGSNGWRLGLY
jgi:hypothetical protein